jgi:hypothetical protein
MMKKNNNFVKTANNGNIYKSNFHNNGFYVISLPEEIINFWTTENIRRLDPFVTGIIFNKCNENDINILKLSKNKDFKNDGKRQQVLINK